MMKSDTATIGQLLQWGAESLKQKNIESQELESEILLAFVLKCDRAGVFLRSPEPASRLLEAKFKRVIARRLTRRPWQYILGQTEFYGLAIGVNRNVLIPRPETELLVEAVLKRSRPEWADILDIGAGSGAISMALAKNLPNVRVTATEVSAKARTVAAMNVKTHGLDGRIKIIKADLFPGFKRKYDCIVSNPPYIPTRQLNGLQPEVSLYEPRQALDGGRDGLSFYRRISRGLKSHLNPGGLLALEIGQGQGPGVRAILKASNPELKIEILKDYSNIQRMVLARNRAK